MRFSTLFRRKTAAKILNLALTIALTLSSLPLAHASAAANTPLNVNADCTISGTGGAKQIFLPFVTKASQSVVAAVTTALDATDGTAAAAPTVRQLNYTVGKTYSYEWNLTIDTNSTGRDKEGSIAQQGQQKTVIRGTANVTIKEKAADGAYSGQVTIDSPYVCSSDGATASVLQGKDYDDLAAALKQPLLFKQTPAGKVLEVAVPQGAPVLAVNMQKGIVNALQSTLKEENSYSAEEQGAQGTYTVKYTIADQADGAHINKSYNQGNFSKLISVGDDTSQLLQNNTIDIVLNPDGVYQSVKSVENMQSSDESKDASSTGGVGLDGVAAWSTVKSEGSLTLATIVDAGSDIMAAALSQSYQVDDLGAEVNIETSNPRGIDLSKVDLNAEFTALEQAPTNPGLIMRIADLVLADSSTTHTVITQIQGRIQQNSTNAPIVNAYIDVLTRVGTPKAQEVMSNIVNSSLVQAADLAATLTITSQEHALISMVLLESPTITAVNTISNVAATAGSTLRDTAVTVLGTTADHLDDAQSGVITSLLLDNLKTATTNEDVTLYLDALGNTGNPAALSTIQSYISGTVSVSDTFGVQVSALTALRKIPGDAAESLLLNVLSTSNQQIQDDQDGDLFAQRELAYAILASRQNLSQAGVAALNQHKDVVSTALPGGYYTFSWNRHLGGSTIGVNLPGYMGIATPPPYYPFFYVRQSADAHVWSHNFNLLYGDLLAKSTGSAFQFRAYMHIGGGLIRREVNYNLPCSYSNGGNLYNTSITVFNVTVSVPVFWALTINVNVRGSGWFSLDWSYSHNVCSFSSGNFIGRITPSVWAHAEASAYLQLLIARGGVTLAADLLRTSIPVRGTISYSGPSTSFCINVSATTQALNGRLYAWGDLWALFLGWRRVVEGNLWTFSTPAGSYTIYDRCY